MASPFSRRRKANTRAIPVVAFSEKIWGHHPMSENLSLGQIQGVSVVGCMPEHAVILLAEDEEDYVFLIKQAFSKAHIDNPLHVVSNGEEAMYYLRGERKYANRDEYPLPDLLLLDLKLPRYSGFEILAWIRSQPGLASLRVLVLTSSDRIKDVNDAYRLGANSFLVKPYDFEDLIHFASLIQEFWLKQSKCPEAFRPPRKNGNDEHPTDPEKIGGKNA